MRGMDSDIVFAALGADDGTESLATLTFEGHDDGTECSAAFTFEGHDAISVLLDTSRSDIRPTHIAWMKMAVKLTS